MKPRCRACGGGFDHGDVGRPPVYCSEGCRREHRAVVKRADRAAVQRRVELEAVTSQFLSDGYSWITKAWVEASAKHLAEAEAEAAATRAGWGDQP